MGKLFSTLNYGGRLVESSIGTHIVNQSISERYNLYYWRDGNYEVDFVLEKGDKVIGLEVKSGMKVDNAGMRIFAERFHLEKALLVGTGGIPYDEFLKINAVYANLMPWHYRVTGIKKFTICLRGTFS